MRWNRAYRKKILDWFTKFFYFTVYLRMLIEAILFIFICLILEISQFKNAKEHTTSYVLTCISVPFIIIAISLIPLHYFMYRDDARISSKYFSELYNGTKNRNACKLYMFIFIIRRFITALVLVSMRSLDIWTRCI